jgi:hypothetical protein
MERQRLLEKWNVVRSMMPAHASPAQISDLKQAFYAGAWAFYYILMNNLSPSTSDTVEPADLDVMAELHNELHAYQKRVEANLE